MGKFFDINGGFFRFMTKVGDFILLNILVLIFSIPVITIGPALTAAYYVALKEVKDEEGYLWRSFWKSFKQNFKQGFVLELIVIVAGVLLYFDFSVCYNWANIQGSMVGRLLMFVMLGFILVVMAAFIYLFPLLAKFSNTIMGTLKNSFIMAMRHLPQTIIMMIITYGIAYFTMQYPLVILLTLGFCIYVDAYILSRIFDTYIKKEEKDPDEYHVPDEESFKEIKGE